MLGRQNYPREYIEHCQEDIAAQIAEFREMPPVSKSFAERLASHLVIVMDACFTHRARNVEGKDGNALNEVRVLAQSLMYGSIVVEDSTVTWDTENMVLGLTKGDEIELTMGQVDHLQRAFFAELTRKYAE